MIRSYAIQMQRASGIRVPSPTLPFALAFIAGLISINFGTYSLSALGIAATTYYFARLVLDTGVDLPFESLILVIASIQWIIGPVMAYAGLSHHYKYYMYVPESEYMAFVVPAVILYSIGLYSFRSNKRIALINYYAGITQGIVSRAGFLPLYLVGIGFVFSFLADKLPISLAFPAYLLSNVKYIGLIYLIFAKSQQHRTAILAAALALTFLSSLQGGLFHDLILWSAFIGMYAAYNLRPTLAKKILLVCAALILIFVIQSAKAQYRASLETAGPGLSSFLAAVEQRFEDKEELRASNTEKLVNRINQGWIISRIIERVPAQVPFAGGDTVVTAIKSSVLPRILYPDKPIAGGKKNYEKYTGYILQEGTSIGISLLGEAYVNFGVKGAWVFMFGFGLLSSFVIKRFFLLAAKYPTIWLWFPLILSHFVKAETELLVQLNFLVKGIFLVYLFVWANKYFFRLKI